MPSSRKRNKGKERKAKKVEAEKVLNNNRWRTWSEGVNCIEGKTIKCDHGCGMRDIRSISDDHPVAKFMSSA